MLYPAELRVQKHGGEGGIRTHDGLLTLSLAGSAFSRSATSPRARQSARCVDAMFQHVCQCQRTAQRAMAERGFNPR